MNLLRRGHEGLNASSCLKLKLEYIIRWNMGMMKEKEENSKHEENKINKQSTKLSK